MKKFLSILLVVMLVLSMIPATVSAATGTVKITFDSTSKRTEFSTSKQVWVENGITVTNNKASSTSNVANYSNPARFYKSSELIIEYPGMTQIEFACSSTSYATALKNSISGSTASGSVVTVKLAGEDSVKYTLTGGQVRMNSLTITYAGAAACTHPEDKLGDPIIPEKPATCTEDGKAAVYLCACGEQVGGEKIPATNHPEKYQIEEGKTATCKAEGKNPTYYCPDCEENIGGENTGYGEHTYVNGACTVCGESQPIIFELGAKGSATHYDGSEKTSHTETVNGYKLEITNCTKMYTGARDEKGNSCIKLGTSNTVGGFQFVAPDDVDKVIIYAAKYKGNTTKLSVNGTTYTLTKSSNDGVYEEIEVDTSVNKTVKVTTVSGGVRAMINSIEFICEDVEEPKGFIGAGNTYDTIEAALKAGVYTLKPVNGAEILDTVSVTIEENGKNVPYTYAALYLEEDEAYTYYSLDIRTVNIRSKRDGMYFTANVKCDPELADRVESYGVVMSLKSLGTEGLTEADYAYTTTETETGLDINESIVSGGVFSIFKNGADNASRGDADVHAKVYLKLKDSDTVLTSVNEVSLDFLTALGKLNDQLGSGKLTLTEAQRTELQAFGQRWSDVLSEKELTNIPGVQAN